MITNFKMAISTSTYIIFVVTFITISLQPLTNGKQLVPCFFSFGDSLFDNGNNNKLITLVKANYLPYGIDFPYGPTGRFNNGFTITDYIAQRIGFGALDPPPFATARGSNAILRGVNHASGSAGILEETSTHVGQRLTMNQQLSNHQETVDQIAILLGNQTAEKLLRKCLYTISIGNNDYENNYYFPLYVFNRIIYTPEEFSDRLIKKFSQQLTTLYNLEARKIAVFAVIPIGCIPQSLSLYPTEIERDGCVGFINNAVQLFNKKLVPLLHNLNTKLLGANFTFINTYAFLSQNLTSTLGIKVPNAPCCKVIKVLGLCVPKGDLCSNRNEYTYLDNYHPTQIVNKYIASRAYTAQSPNDAIPFDIRTLIKG